jgi:hypothetical protein
MIGQSFVVRKVTKHVALSLGKSKEEALEIANDFAVKTALVTGDFTGAFLAIVFPEKPSTD